MVDSRAVTISDEADFVAIMVSKETDSRAAINFKEADPKATMISEKADSRATTNFKVANPAAIMISRSRSQANNKFQGGRSQGNNEFQGGRSPGNNGPQEEAIATLESTIWEAIATLESTISETINALESAFSKTITTLELAMLESIVALEWARLEFIVALESAVLEAVLEAVIAPESVWGAWTRAKSIKFILSAAFSTIVSSIESFTFSSIVFIIVPIHATELKVITALVWVDYEWSATISRTSCSCPTSITATTGSSASSATSRTAAATTGSPTTSIATTSVAISSTIATPSPTAIYYDNKNRKMLMHLNTKSAHEMAQGYSRATLTCTTARRTKREQINLEFIAPSGQREEMLELF
ncbi:hypothetical protein TCAL_16744 [Tigriopus californicus]|uniref:Uncharacterized protein n=1 Tax=Tigriopus californicus TaxID=6832 RepID=A0A553PSG4_TIGCA|nr:hypothetical protein TCAL_16744 [Tigriopus californicus]